MNCQFNISETILESIVTGDETMVLYYDSISISMDVAIEGDQMDLVLERQK